MTILRLVGLAFGVIGFGLVVVLVIGFLLPSEWQAERDAVLSAPPEEIFPHLESAEAWTRWTPSPETGIELFGPPRGEGSGRRWDDPGYGQGEFVITEVDAPRLVAYEVEVEGGSIRILGEIRLRQEPQGTRVLWREEGDFGWNPLLGYLAGRMNELQGAQLEASLRALRELVREEPGPG